MVASRDGARVQFAHALIREALYEGILPMRRRVGTASPGRRDGAGAPGPGRGSAPLPGGGGRAGIRLADPGGRSGAAAYAYVVAGDRFEAALALLETSDATAGERGWLLWRLPGCAGSAIRGGVSPISTRRWHCARQVGDQLLVGNALLDRGLLLNFVGRIRLGLDDMRPASRRYKHSPPRIEPGSRPCRHFSRLRMRPRGGDAGIAFGRRDASSRHGHSGGTCRYAMPASSGRGRRGTPCLRDAHLGLARAMPHWGCRKRRRAPLREPVSCIERSAIT